MPPFSEYSQTPTPLIPPPPPPPPCLCLASHPYPPSALPQGSTEAQALSTCFSQPATLSHSLPLTPFPLPPPFNPLCTQHNFCRPDSGELADVLDMAPSDLALRIIPAAIPKLTEDKSREGLEALAHSVGYGLQQMMLDYGHHVVAKYLYGGNVPPIVTA